MLNLRAESFFWIRIHEYRNRPAVYPNSLSEFIISKQKKLPIMSSEASKLRSPETQPIPMRREEVESAAQFHPTSSKKGNTHRGFAAMTAEQQKQIASKGGEAVSKNREHMSEIGKKGGERVSRNRKHMSDIGRKGGEASKASRNGNGNGKP